MRGSDVYLQTLAFRAIERAAVANLPCPTNAALAGLLGLKSTGSASAIVFALEASGQIAVERFGQARRVTIVATGKSTFYDSGRRKMKQARPRPLQRTPTMPRRRPDLRLDFTPGQSRAEQIRAECAAEAAARLDRQWAARATGTVTGNFRNSLLEREGGEAEVRGRPCFRCGARGACNHRNEEWALHG